jgi:NitT/TauT family transport system permease protein
MRSKAALALKLAAFYGGLLLLWQVIYEAQIWSPYLFPEPERVWLSLRRYIDNGVLFDSLADTMKSMVVGFAIAFALGMIMGVSIATFRWLDETLGSLVVGMQSLPSVTWLPLAILWFGIDSEAITFVVVLGSVWAIAISARDGVRNIPGRPFVM